MASFLKSLSSNSLSKNKYDSIKTSYLQSYAQQLNHFPKALTTNDDTLFIYIRHLVTGSYSDQKNYNEYIFNHLKNVIDHEFNTLTLRNTCKFIMTLILLGNLHIYQNLVKYLLPSMVNKINQAFSKSINSKTDQVKPIWHLTQFFTETLFVIAQWIPEDFYNLDKPSIFAKIKQKYHLQIKQFKYFNMEKIFFCYRIIKDLAITNLEQKCDQCGKKQQLKNGKPSNCYNFKKNFHQKSRVQNRKKLLKSTSSRGTDIAWETGFSIFTELQSIEEEGSSSGNNSSRQENPKLKSKRVWSPGDYECFNTKQLQQKQFNIMEKLKDVKKNVKDVNNGLYELEQKRLLKQYDQKRQKVRGIKYEQFGLLKNLTQLQKREQLTPAHKSQNRSTARKQAHLPSMPHLSPRNKQVEKAKQQFHSNHLQIFGNYLKSKSALFENKFKIALISSKGNIHLMKMGKLTLKCRTYCREKMLKLKLFVQENKEQNRQRTEKKEQRINYVKNKQQKINQVKKEEIAASNRKGQLSKLGIQSQLTDIYIDASIPATQFQYIEPKRCLDSYKSQDQKTELILNYGTRNENVIIEPILIKLNNQTIYLPIGYWHMVMGSTKKILQMGDNKAQQSNSQKHFITVCRKQRVLLNKDIAISLGEMSKMLRKQFEIQDFSKRDAKGVDQRQNPLRWIQLRGSMMQVNFSIIISSQIQQSAKTTEEYLTFTGKVQPNECQDLQNNTEYSSHLYIQSLVNELVFIFGQSKGQTL